MAVKLQKIFTDLSAIIIQHQPDMVAIEDVFYAVNVKTALKLGQVRGVAMLAASSCGLQVAEYSPLSIKSAVVGYGRAEKHQVQQMVTRLLNLDALPEPTDASDALAIAICHIHTATTNSRYEAATK
jgi:crossover junction endodeoxyribonuclease RuvC